MAKTKLADIIEPSVFAPYAVERTAALSRLVQSGIVQINDDFNDRASGEGEHVGAPVDDARGRAVVFSVRPPVQVKRALAVRANVLMAGNI